MDGPSKRSSAAAPTLSRSQQLIALAQHKTLHIALLSALLMWSALPPLELGFLGWIAAAPLVWLARLPQLPGRRPYGALWLAGFVFWSVTLYWLCLPHPLTSIGWFALSFYLAFYTPLIVGLTRAARKHLRLSVVVAAPLVWVAADQARAWLWSGFSMACLAHSQYRNVTFVQCADLCGEFGLTLAMVAVGAAVARTWPTPDESFVAVRALRWIVVGAAIIGAVWGYGFAKLRESPQDAKHLQVALIQGSIASEVKHNPDKLDVVYRHYLELSQQAVASHPQVELIVWPETMFPYLWGEVSDDAQPKPGITWEVHPRQTAAFFRDRAAETVINLRRPTLLGIPVAEIGNQTWTSFNSALYFTADGRMRGRYDKQHRVMFGEYIPLAEYMPWLYEITPLTGGIVSGAASQSFQLGEIHLSPNICYETALARVIRRQVGELTAAGNEPDLLVNLTNDSWFRGSSELDLHLACGVFRAVECRKPLVIAANTGFSAYIDADGRIVAQSQRGAAEALVVDVQCRGGGGSLYLLVGDWLCNLAVAAAGLFAALGLWNRRLVGE